MSVYALIQVAPSCPQYATNRRAASGDVTTAMSVAAFDAAPGPSMIVAFVRATPGSPTVTNSRVLFDIDATACAPPSLDSNESKINPTVIRMCFNPALIDSEPHHHPRRKVLGDVTV